MVTGQDRRTGDSAAWFLYSEQNEPMGQVYRSGDNATPRLSERLTGGVKWGEAEVMAFREMTSTCAVRRFQVIIRVTKPRS